MTESALEQTDPAAIFRDWWRDLVKPTKKGQSSRRGELAELRRCKNLDEVLFVPTYHAIYFRLRDTAWRDRLRVAAVTGTLAHVEGEPDPNAPKSFAAYLATPAREGGSPRVKELRFQRLMKEKELAEFYPALLRILHLVGDKAPLLDLIKGVYYWGDHNRREWTFAYYDQLLKNE